jgi:hypothetical protein
MKTKLPNQIIVGLLAASSLVSPGLAGETPRAGEKVSWKVAGELEEACSCRAPCPCWFKSLPSRMTCDGVQVVFINKGRYGKTRLDGLAVAQFVQSPEGKSMFESFGNWNIDNCYIDERANEAQRAALKELAAHFFPPAAKKREFRYVPISRKIDGDEHTVIVGTCGYVAGHLVDGGYGGAPKVSNPPLADPTHKEFLQGEATLLTYSDAGQGWKYKNSNYMRNKFQADDREYAQFEAEMARKMTALKKQAEPGNK